MPPIINELVIGHGDGDGELVMVIVSMVMGPNTSCGCFIVPPALCSHEKIQVEMAKECR